jgi:hypothetical protein
MSLQNDSPPPKQEIIKGKLGGYRPGSGRKKKSRPLKSRTIAEMICAGNRTPLHVMYDNMLFWADQVDIFSFEIKKLIINAEDEEERAEAFKLLRQFLAAREHSQSCAVDLAPYCHPRLQSIAINNNPVELSTIEALPVDQVDASRLYQRLIG